MLLSWHLVILCLLGVVLCKIPITVDIRVSSPDGKAVFINQRYLEAEDIDKLGEIVNEAANVTEKLIDLFHLIADPVKVPGLRKGPLADQIRASLESGKSFVRQIESVNTALEPYAAKEGNKTEKLV
ncbi:uncharacterized protein [Penaeus vannamei]|uniref:uncharacterized protein n=1 Tax=Penaeus vannamei TaxID=6689 RepID=UPI00387F724D